MIVVDESEPVGEIEPPFESRDVQIRRGLNVRDFYEMEEEIGRGKFGTVFKCREKKTGLRLAAKFVQAAKKADRINVEREVEIMKSLRNPRLIQLYDAFDDGKKEICLLLELIEGGELFERVIDDDFVLTERACAIFMRQICEGIQFIHLQHVLHLDMKPENILCLTRAGNRIKLIDFGLARRYDPSKKLQVLFGTPEFVAPEVVNFDLIGYGTDMWSVGIIGYVLLSGLSPFMGETDVETMANVTIAKYDFDDEAFNDVSAEAKDFISKLLVKQISKRMTSTESLRHPWLRPRPPLPTVTPTTQTEEQPSSTTNASTPSTPPSPPPTEPVPIVSNISLVPEAVVVMDSRTMPTSASDIEPDKPPPTLNNQITTSSSSQQEQSTIEETMNSKTKPDVPNTKLANKSSICSLDNQIMTSIPNKDVQDDQPMPAPKVNSSITLPETPGVKQDYSSTPTSTTQKSEDIPSLHNSENLLTSLTTAAEVKDLITQSAVSDVQSTNSSVQVPHSKPIPQPLNLDNASISSSTQSADFPDILQVAKVNLRQFVERWNSHPNSPFQLNSDSPRRTISLLISNSPSQLDASSSSQPDASPTSLKGMSPSPPCSMPTSPIVKNQPTEKVLDAVSDLLRESVKTEIVSTENQSNHSSVVESNGTTSKSVVKTEASSSSTAVEAAIEQTSVLLKSVKDSLIRQMESGTAVRDRTGARVWDRKGSSPAAPPTFVQHRRMPQAASVFTYAVQKFESKQTKQPISSKFRQPQEPKPQKPQRQPSQPNNEPVGNIEDWEVHPPVEARSFLPKINKQINKYTISTSSCSMNNSSTTVIKIESHKP